MRGSTSDTILIRVTEGREEMREGSEREGRKLPPKSRRVD